MNPFTTLENVTTKVGDFSLLMSNWLDVINNTTFKVADSTGTDTSRNSFSVNSPSSSNTSKTSKSGQQASLLKPGNDNKSQSSSTTSSSRNSSQSGNESKSDSSKSSNSKQGSSNQRGSDKKSKRMSVKKPKKSKIKKGGKSRKSLLSTFEVIGNTSNDLTVELQHGNEGFDMHISQNVCDDSRPVAGKEAESYFLMRHSFQYPGPWMTMMQGPSAATSGGGAYRVSAEAVHKEKYVLVGTYNNNTVEGVWEQTWNNNIKSQVTFLAGFLTAQQRQMQMMMGGSGPKFPSIMAYTDFKFQNWASKVRLDMMNNEMSISLNRRLTDNLMVGSRIATTYDQRKTGIEFGARYVWYSPGSSYLSGSSSSQSKSDNDSSSSNDKQSKKGSKNTIEALIHKDSLMAQFFYTKNVTDNCALTSRLMWAVGSTDRIMTSVGYKYQFGRHQGAAKVICGEISSDGNIRQSLTFPLLTNMLVKFHAEMNHFLTPERMQRGEFPHKFGISLNIHL